MLWPAENAFFKGQITGFNAAKGLHHVKYKDGVFMRHQSLALHSVNPCLLFTGAQHPSPQVLVCTHDSWRLQALTRAMTLLTVSR